MRSLLMQASLVLVIVAMGCAPSAPGGPSSRAEGAAPSTSAPKHVLAAIRGSPISLAQRRTQPQTGSVPGLDRKGSLPDTRQPRDRRNTTVPAATAGFSSPASTASSSSRPVNPATRGGSCARATGAAAA